MGRDSRPSELDSKNQTMARGGSRPGAGRKKGSAAKLDAIARQKAIEGGLTPLEYMLAILRDTGRSDAERMDAAKAAAPYVHARLTSAEVKNETTHRYVARVPDKAVETTTWQMQYSPDKTIQ